MDYVVAGLGIGAILALIGFALWELFGDVEEPGVNWLSRVAIGLMIGSLVIWSVTIVSLISHTDDSRGSRLVLLTTLVTLIAIGAGAFWYWRADRALAATRPRAEKTDVQRDIPAMATASGVAATEDIELTDWDSWPDRVEEQPDTAAIAAAVAPPQPSFEPEVAAEAAAVEIVEDASEEAEVVAESGEDAAIVVMEDTVIAETVAAVGLAAPVDPVEVAEQPEPELPANVRLLPVRQLPAPEAATAQPAADPISVEAEAEPNESAELDMIEAEPVAPHVETIEDETLEVVALEAETIEDGSIEEVVIEEVLVERQGVVEIEAAEEPPAFESALLSDVDGSLAADDGGYRSPLLSDLGPDQLEGVGLARWRPEARLTDEGDDEMPPARTGRR